MPRPLSLATVPAVALLGLVAIPAASTAATIAPSAPCYSRLFEPGKPIRYEPLTGTITGGTPGGRFQIYGVAGEASSQLGTFDAAGNAAFSLDSYIVRGIDPSAGQTVKLEVTEFTPGGSTVTGSASVKVTSITVDVASKPRSPRSRRVVRVSGTPFAKRKLYGFIVRGTKSSRVLRRFSLGTANACGYARTRAVVSPPGSRTGSYRLYVNAGRKLDKDRALAYGFRIRRSAF